MTKVKETSPKQGYSLTAKILHWGFVLLFIYGVIKQVGNVNQLTDTSLLIFEVSFATIFCLLLLVRFTYMKKTQSSSLPAKTYKLQRLAAKVVHLGMYISLAAIAITGMIIGFLFWVGIKNGFILDGIVGLHEFFVLLIYWLIAIHVVAAFYHRLLKDGVWSSMVPFWKE